MLKYILYLLLPCVCAAQSLDQSSRLMAERMKLTSEFARLSNSVRTAKTPGDADKANLALADLAERADNLRKEIKEANMPILIRLQPYAQSATIKAAYEKLRNADTALASLPLPSGPSFGPQELNQVQILLDRMKTTIEIHRHGAANVR